MFLSVQNLQKSFGQTDILRNCSFDLSEGKTLSILGKSGCGKTTLLKIIAGLLDDFGGDIFLNDENVNQKTPQTRNIVYLYQEPLLFPHLNVFENVAFGLVLRKIPSAIIKTKTEMMLQELELSDQMLKKPHQLSGGQKQRVAFGRALIIEPKLLLLDEPFGALDVETRATMQHFFKKIVVQHQISSVFVTHDLKEAVLLGDNLGFMENGQLKIYAELADFVADEKTGMKGEIEFWKSII
jgi:ABC-type sugar transport system ATPase subunit